MVELDSYKVRVGRSSRPRRTHLFLGEELMSTHRLVISIPFDISGGQSDEDCVEMATDVLRQLEYISDCDPQISLVREGDRSGGNLLLPKLSGRFGEHLQGKKATWKDLAPLFKCYPSDEEEK